MDYIVITRDEYADFHIKDHRGPQLSPDDLDLWRLSLNNEFGRMQQFVKPPPYDVWKLPLQKRINLAIAFTLMLIGLLATAYMAWKTIL